MSSASPPNIDDNAFLTTFADHLVTLKQNFDATGNLKGPLPTTRIPQFFTAEFGNLLDDLVIKLRGRLKNVKSVTEFGALLDGVADDTIAMQAAYDQAGATGGDSGGTIIVGLGTLNHTALTLFPDVRTLHICEGTPETFRTGQVGDLAFRVDGADVLYRKTTANSATGWVVAVGTNPTLRRVVEAGGTQHVAGDYALSAGWGATASIFIVEATDMRGSVDVTALGAGQAANPTVILTFQDGAYPVRPNAVASRGDSEATAGRWRVTASDSSTVTFTFIGTPVAAEVYRLLYQVVG